MARSECRACGLLFSSNSAFDMHRVGSYGEGVRLPNGTTKYSKHSRRCLNEQEMLDKKMAKNEKGFWTSGGTFDRSVFDKPEEEEQES